MTYASEILENVRAAAAPSDAYLTEARRRRDAVLGEASRFPSVRGRYVSGSIAHGTANTVKDADGGVVLDRRAHAELGPDGDDVGPMSIVAAVRQHLRESDLSDIWPGISYRITNRAIKVFFDEPLEEGCDPTVDLIVALERSSAPGLWIPKGMEGAKPTWDASHPEKHTALFLPADLALRRTRVRTTRLAKLVNDRYTNWTFSSFNLAALAHFAIDEPLRIDNALLVFYEYAAKDLKDHLTPDPAEVSGPIRLPRNVTKDQAVQRMEKHRNLVEEAVEAATRKKAQEALAKLLPAWVDAPAGGAASVASALAMGGTAGIGRQGLEVGSPTARNIKKDVRSYGG